MCPYVYSNTTFPYLHLHILAFSHSHIFLILSTSISHLCSSLLPFLFSHTQRKTVPIFLWNHRTSLVLISFYFFNYLVCVCVCVNISVTGILGIPPWFFLLVLVWVWAGTRPAPTFYVLRFCFFILFGFIVGDLF